MAANFAMQVVFPTPVEPTTAIIFCFPLFFISKFVVVIKDERAVIT